MAPSCLMYICKKQSLSSIVGAPCRIHVVAALGANGYECDPEQHRHGFSYTHIINGNGKLIEVTKSTKFTEDEIVRSLVPYTDKYEKVVDVTDTQRDELRVSIRRKRESSNASLARGKARANGSTDPEHALQQKKWTPDNCRTFSNGHTAPCPLQFINDCPNMAPMKDNEQGEAKSSLKVDIRQANKSENTMVEAKRTPKPSLLTSMEAEEESDDISPAGIAKPLSSDTVATFNSSGDTPGQLKKPPEKKLTSNMLKFGLGESVPVDNPKPDGDDYELSEAEDQVPEDELEVVPVAVIAGPEEQPEIAPPDVANAMAAGAGAPEPTETTKKRKGGGKLTANATNRNLTKLAKVDKKGMKSIGSFFGPR